jgi:hypothetical protein
MNDEHVPGGSLRSQRPRNPRVPVEFALQVQGTDTNGEPFQLPAQAVKISRGGATLIIDADVETGSVVRLSPASGRELDAEVNGTWTDEIDGRRRIGVKLLDDDGWFAE